MPPVMHVMESLVNVNACLDTMEEHVKMVSTYLRNMNKASNLISWLLFTTLECTQCNKDHIQSCSGSSDGDCVCKVNYHGTNCENNVCPQCNSDGITTCTADTCTCKLGFYGTNCDSGKYLVPNFRYIVLINMSLKGSLQTRNLQFLYFRMSELQYWWNSVM